MMNQELGNLNGNARKKSRIFKNISTSDTNLPFFILLFNKLLKVDGLIIADILLNWVISNSSEIRLIFCIIGSDFINEKK